MVLPLESNLTLIEVFLSWVNHADNLPVLVSIMNRNWHLNHIHPLLIVLRRKKKSLIPVAVKLIRRTPAFPVYHPCTSKVLLPTLILQKPCPCYFSTAHLDCRLLLRIVYSTIVVKPARKNHRVPRLNFQNKTMIRM